MKLVAYKISESGIKREIFCYSAGSIDHRNGAYYLYNGITTDTLFKIITPESSYTWELEIK